MAPQLQPRSLYSIALSSVSHLVDHACSTIFLEYGSYGNEECLSAIENLQGYLIDSLPLTLFENLAADRNATSRSNYHSLLIWSKDPRIKLGVFLHPSIRKFSVDGKGSELILFTQQVLEDYPGSSGSYMGGLDEVFWCTQLRRLVNIVSLNLNLITTDEILLLIGANCHKLEEVNIVSRIKQDNFHNYSMSNAEHPHGQGDPPNNALATQFPGITLKFCVSDLGLRALLNCQRLRRITMNKMANHIPPNHGITYQGMRTLLFGLPNLEYINFGSLGKVIAQDPQQKVTGVAKKRKVQGPLKLTHFNEIDPNYMNIQLLESLCPNLQHISLALPIAYLTNGQMSPITTLCRSILEALCDSTLNLKILELQNFPFCDTFKKLLKCKGANLTELLVGASASVDYPHLIYIGENCPNLQRLSVKDLRSDQNQAEPEDIDSPTVSKPIFTKLLTLHLSGHYWQPNIILPLVLTSALKITKIGLINVSYRSTMDRAMLKVLQKNPLSKVSSINLYNGCFISSHVIRRLIFGCESLTGFSFIQTEIFHMNEVEQMKQEIISKNLNIRLCCLELG